MLIREYVGAHYTINKKEMCVPIICMTSNKYRIAHNSSHRHSPIKGMECPGYANFEHKRKLLLKIYAGCMNSLLEQRADNLLLSNTAHEQ